MQLPPWRTTLSVFFIRPVYDKAIDHGHQVVVATLPHWSISLMPSEDGLAQLTNVEHEQLKALLAQHRADVEELSSRYMATSASSWLTTLAKSLKEGQQLRSEQAEVIWRGMGEVTKSSHEAGYTKPKAARKAEPAPALPAPPREAAAGESSASDAKHVRKPRTAKVKTSTTPENGRPE